MYKVLIPFHRSLDDKDYVPGDLIDISEEELAKIKSINVNMVVEVEEKPKKKRTKKQ